MNYTNVGKNFKLNGRGPTFINTLNNSIYMLLQSSS